MPDDTTIAVRFNLTSQEQCVLFEHAKTYRNASGELRRLAYLGFQVEHMGLDLVGVARLLGASEGFSPNPAKPKFEDPKPASSDVSNELASFARALRQR